MARIPQSSDASASGFALLAALAADATAHGIAVTPSPPPQRLGRHVAFEAAGTAWLLPISEIAAVARAPRVTRVAGTRRCFRGLAFIESQMTPVLDLAEFLGESAGASTGASASTVLVLARSPRAALIVDQVLGLVVPEDPVSGSAEREAEAPALRAWSCARAQVGARELSQFDLDRLFADPHFLDVTNGVTDP